MANFFILSGKFLLLSLGSYKIVEYSSDSSLIKTCFISESKIQSFCLASKTETEV